MADSKHYTPKLLETPEESQRRKQATVKVIVKFTFITKAEGLHS